MHTTSAHRPVKRVSETRGLFLVPLDTALEPGVPRRRRTDREARWTTTHLVMAALVGPLLWVVHLVLARVLHV